MTKIGLRKIWFQFHKWIGLILAVAIIPLSISGSALVWHDQIERMLHPARHAVQGPAKLAPGAYAAAAERALNEGERLTRLVLPEEAGEPVTATAMSPVRPGKRPVRATLYLDPADGHVIDAARSNEGVFPVLHVLHGSLMVPGVGRQIVGWIGVAMLISCVSGLWLWWPTVGSWLRGLRWKRHRNTDTNLHHLLGFWIALPLFVLSLTGAWISFPQFFGMFDGAQAARRAPGGPPFLRMAPAERVRLPVEDAVAQATALVPGSVRSIAWPTRAKAEWRVEVASGRGRPATVAVDDANGIAVRAPAEARGGREGETVARLMRRIHDGSDMPLVWQVIVFLGGILPAVLAVTGIIMWWRARGWRARLRARMVR